MILGGAVEMVYLSWNTVNDTSQAIYDFAQGPLSIDIIRLGRCDSSGLHPARPLSAAYRGRSPKVGQAARDESRPLCLVQAKATTDVP